MLIGPQNSPIATSIANNLRSVRAGIQAAADAAQRSVDSITLVAVSKGHDAAQVRAAAACGARDIGESYLQEAGPKIQALRDLPLTWHFIGRVQANKTRPIAEQFDWVHAVDRLRIAERLSQQRPAQRGALQLCLEVNIGGESAKGGVAPGEAAALVRAIGELQRIRLRGLMCILPAGADSQSNRRLFGELARLQRQLNAQGAALDTLSMGMSADYADAIAEGATLIRIGTAIFGAR